MRSDMMDCMAQAIEKACVVIMLISENYSRSVYCKREALYSVDLKRHIIPCTVQANFTPRGWLGKFTILQNLLIYGILGGMLNALD